MKDNLVIMAVDPGKQGGLAVRWPGGEITHASFKKSEFGDILEELEDVITKAVMEGWEAWAYFEKPPWTLGKKVPEASAMVFGWNCGMLMGAIRAFKYMVVEVTPHRYLKYGKDIKTTGEKKRHNREQARKRFPTRAREITIEVADAYLLLSYAIGKHEQQSV